MIKLTELLPSQIKENLIYDGYIAFTIDPSEVNLGFDPYDAIHFILKNEGIDAAVSVNEEGRRTYRGIPFDEFTFRIVTNDDKIKKVNDLIKNDLQAVESMLAEKDYFPPLHAMDIDKVDPKTELDPNSPLLQIDPKVLRDKCKKINKDTLKTDLHKDCLEDYIEGYM